jgi:hypothetical protein
LIVWMGLVRIVIHFTPNRAAIRCAEGGVDLGVVVEVNENVKMFGPSFGMRNCFGIAGLFDRAPQLDALSPPVESFVVETRGLLSRR